MEKITNVKALTAVLDTCKDMLPADVVEKLTVMRDSYTNKKPSKAQAEKQAQNKEYKGMIVGSMEQGKWYTIPELYQAIPGLTGVEHGRVARMLTDLVREQTIDRKEAKGKAMFSLPVEVAEDIAE